MSAPRRVARNAAVRMGGEIVAKLASLAFFVVMARELGARGFGEFQFALALTGALIYLAGFGTDQLLAREVARDRGTRGPAAGRRRRREGARRAADARGGGADRRRSATPRRGAGRPSTSSALGALLEVLSKSWHSIFQGYERLDLVSATLIVQRTLTAAVGIAVLLSGGGLVAARSSTRAGRRVAVRGVRAVRCGGSGCVALASTPPAGCRSCAPACRSASSAC